ncbi:MAG: TetR/AcrR family transcriptional regulator C-terminal domain-containing protein [Clostridia bacterium]|nr:TetR/AcrR family transcriptional regulator C-terminal domain-containing protein [Clostridia bacterium]
MSTNTKNLIFRTFVEILGEKPFDKITVRDIVERANVNRNTFYYYYSDIYELLEEMFTREFTEMVAEHRNGFRWLVGFSNLLTTAYNNKKIINNICASRSYEYLENYMFKSCKIILSEFIHEISEGRNISEDIVDFTASFYMYAIIGTLSEWFRTGMYETPDNMLKKFMVVFETIIPTMMRTQRQIKNDSSDK